jgi:1-acyl-sn-glycerol-3-phosphate acyltransferase
MRKLLYILYQPYKWLFFIPFFFINILFFGSIGTIIATFISPKAGGKFAGAIWARTNAFFTPIMVSVSGKENIQKNTSYIVIPNHQSYYDIFVIYGWIGIDIKWVMKKELRKIPGLGIASEKIGHIFLDRSNKKQALDSLNKAKQKLVNGTSVVMFPEGTRSVTGQLNPFKRGAFKLAFDLGLPILPVTLIGTKDILPADSMNIFPGKVQMIIHQPIDITKYSEEDVKLLMDYVSEIISKPLINN